MLEHILLDGGLYASSVAADNLSTYFIVKKRGLEAELNLNALETMKEHGAGKGLVKKTVASLVAGLAGGSALYGMDYLVGIEDKIANLHHIFIWGAASLRYSASISNTFNAFGMRKAAKIFHSYPHFLTKALFNPIGSYIRKNR